MKTDLESYRRGFHVGDRVAVTFHTNGADREREGVIRSWSWHGRNFSEKDDLRADVAFEKRDGSGSYSREVGVANMKSLAKKPAEKRTRHVEIVVAKPVAIFGGGRAATFDKKGNLVTEGPVGGPVAEPEWGACDGCGALTRWPGADVSCDGEGEEGEACEGVYIPSDENGEPL